MLTLKIVNKAAAQYGVQLTRGLGYFYWLDLNGKLLEGVESEMVYRLNHLTLDQWMTCAADAARQYAECRCKRGIHTQPQIVIPSKASNL